MSKNDNTDRSNLKIIKPFLVFSTSRNSCVFCHPFHWRPKRAARMGAEQDKAEALCSHSMEPGWKSCSQVNPAAEREARRAGEDGSAWSPQRGPLMAFPQWGNVCRACLGKVLLRGEVEQQEEVNTGQEIRKGYCCPHKSFLPGKSHGA